MTTTTTAPLDANNSVTPINQLPLRDALGEVLAPLMRVEHVRTGQRGHILRLDLRSRRAVVTFDDVEGQVTQPDTMRQAHLLKVRRNNKKAIMMAKPAPKKGKVAKVKAAVEAGKADA